MIHTSLIQSGAGKICLVQVIFSITCTSAGMQKNVFRALKTVVLPMMLATSLKKCNHYNQCLLTG